MHKEKITVCRDYEIEYEGNEGREEAISAAVGGVITERGTTFDGRWNSNHLNTGRVITERGTI